MITNKKNGKKYIGQTIQKFSRRWSHHLNQGNALFSAVKKYGKDNFKQEIIDEAKTIEELNSKEKFWIKKHNTLSPNGYNLTTGGEGFTVSEESKKRMSLAHIGKKASPEQLKNMSEAQKIAQLKPSVVADKKERMSGNKYCVGRKPWNKGLENCFGKEIKCIELDMIFPSIAEASRKLKIDGSGIAKVLSGKRNHCGGYKFEYGTLT